MRTTGLGALALSSLLACNPYAAQRSHLATYRPVALRPLADPAGLPTLKLRVYVEEDHQRVTSGWQVRVYEQVARASEAWAGSFGVGLQIAELRSWREPSARAHLGVALEELARLDAGEDVDFVLGFVGPLSFASSAFHELGMAHVLGRHMVVRGFDDHLEVDAFARAFPDLSIDERERVYRARVRHKEVVILLHELAHLLGAVHVRADASVMSDAWSTAVSGFDPDTRRLLAASLAAPDRDGRIAAVVAALEHDPESRWLASARATLLARLRGGDTALARLTDEVRVPHQRPEGAGRREVIDPLEPVRAHLGAGEFEAAWAAATELLAGATPDPRALRLACAAGASIPARRAEAVEICERAIAATPEASEARLNLLLALGDDAPLERLAATEAALAERADTTPPHWAFLAQLYQRGRWASRAEAVAQRVPELAEAKDVLAWVKRARAHFGLPEDHPAPGLDPAREPAYFAARERLREAVAARDHTNAMRLASALLRDFPGLPGPDRELCTLSVQAKRYREAEATCARAVAAHPEDANPLIYLGYLELARGRSKAAAPHFEAARQLQPERREIWRLLAAAYRGSHQGARLKAVTAEYRERFGEALP